jgi:hypothetical protein
VQTDETTKFSVPGVEHPSIADLQVGARVAGEGVVEDDGAIRATLVVVLPEQTARLGGEVSAVEETTLVLETSGGAVDVLTDGGTIFRVPGLDDPALDDVEVGDRVIAAGTWEDEAAFRAIGVGVRGDRRAGQRAGVRGWVINVGGGSLVVGTLRGPVTVVVDGDTRCRVPGVDEAGIQDIEAGTVVGVRGTWNDDGTLQAAGVAVLSRGNP